MFKNLGNTHNWIHVILVGPLIAYIGHNKNKTQDKYYNFLMILSIMIFFMIRFPEKFKLDYHNVIKLVHYFIWFPLLYYVSLKKNNINESLYELLKIIGIMAFSYHGYNLVNKLVTRYN